MPRLLRHYDEFEENLQKLLNFFIYNVIQTSNWWINIDIVNWIFNRPSYLQSGRANPLKPFTQFDCKYDMRFSHTFY